MNFPSVDHSNKFPPSLTMDEYVEFLEQSLSHVCPEKLALQKAIEEDIKIPFSFCFEGPDFELSPEWQAEIKRRADQVERGEVEGIPADEVMAEIRKRLEKRKA